jgi:hypothetical protein
MGQAEDMTNYIERMDDRIEALEAALRRIAEWSDAYPLEVFPEPDLARARVVLEAADMSLDAISASAMRHVVVGIGKIAKDALGDAA